jgi:hypothetical protein
MIVYSSMNESLKGNDNELNTFHEVCKQRKPQVATNQTSLRILSRFVNNESLNGDESDLARNLNEIRKRRKPMRRRIESRTKSFQGSQITKA